MACAVGGKPLQGVLGASVCSRARIFASWFFLLGFALRSFLALASKLSGSRLARSFPCRRGGLSCLRRVAALPCLAIVRLGVSIRLVGSVRRSSHDALLRSRGCTFRQPTRHMALSWNHCGRCRHWGLGGTCLLAALLQWMGCGCDDAGDAVGNCPGARLTSNASLDWGGRVESRGSGHGFGRSCHIVRPCGKRS